MKSLIAVSLVGEIHRSYVGDDRIYIDCDFSGATMQGAQFRNATFVGCKFIGTDLYWCSAFMMKAIRCHFENVDFRGANLASVTFVQCKIKHCAFGKDNLGGIGLSDNIEYADCEITGSVPIGPGA